MGERVGHWQQTFTGRQFWACDPRAEEVDIDDIAHALALQCRFGGHCRVPYSVAEHSVRVAREVWESACRAGVGADEAGRLALAGLLHDASEAYCVDVPRPLKPFLGGYKEIERGIAAAVAARFGFDAELFDHPLVMRADEVLLATEARDLMREPPAAWRLSEEALPERLTPWAWWHAQTEFLTRFRAFVPYATGVRP